MKTLSHNEVYHKDSFYIPARYIFTMLLILFEILMVIGAVVVLVVYVPYFYISVIITQIICALAIVNSTDNPDYKVPWILAVLVLPIAGFMLYFMFYRRNITKFQMRKINVLTMPRIYNDDKALQLLEKQNTLEFTQAKMLKTLADTHVYQNTNIKYFNSGKQAFDSMLEDLKKAKEFIFIDYFIIQEGVIWNSILNILKEKVLNNVEVRVIYDDFGCMTKLPGNYFRTLQKMGINAAVFCRLRKHINSEYNNRNHRKITIIDGKIAYTGGMNLADEYANIITPYGHWKDAGIRLEGEAVDELTHLVLMDYGMCKRKEKVDFEKYYRNHKVKNKGFVIPFGDGPKPIYPRNVAKSLIMNMLSQAKDYVYIATPYLIIDNELTQSIENAALRGIDVRIITPHIPDKKIAFSLTRSYYDRLIKYGVKIYEYEPGFIHSKIYLSDDKVAIIGTVNLDYRSLVHHYENGVWIYDHDVIKDIKADYMNTKELCISCPYASIHSTLIKRLLRSIVYIFAPLF